MFCKNAIPVLKHFLKNVPGTLRIISSKITPWVTIVARVVDSLLPLSTLTSTTKDDEFLKKIHAHLPGLLRYLGLGESLADTDTMLDMLIKFLKQLRPVERGKYLHAINSYLTKQIGTAYTDNIPRSTVDLLTSITYYAQKNNLDVTF